MERKGVALSRRRQRDMKAVLPTQMTHAECAALISTTAAEASSWLDARTSSRYLQRPYAHGMLRLRQQVEGFPRQQPRWPRPQAHNSNDGARHLAADGAACASVQPKRTTRSGRRRQALGKRHCLRLLI